MKVLVRLLNAGIVFIVANLYSLIVDSKYLTFGLLAVIFICAFILINIFPSYYGRKMQTFRLRNCHRGSELLSIFLLSSGLSALYLILLAFRLFPSSPFTWLIGFLITLGVELIVFINGIIRVYLTSNQLYIKWRVIGVLVGWIPLLNLFVLVKIIKISRNESDFENRKIILNDARKDKKICQTKYPLLMVHGVFFRDFKYLNYWGRIPKELTRNGAKIYYGNQQSAASAADCGKELAERIEKILDETGAKKVNIIAHSKGGLDSRYAISAFGAENAVASLTTISTPHYGCLFADYLLSKLPKRALLAISKRYNQTLAKLGDKNPDFLAAVTDLTAASCKKMNETIKDAPGVFYQSVGSKLNKSWGGRLPLNISYPLVRHFDGVNDGLVSTDSFAWGEARPILTVKGRRGISHGDMIDLFRENIPDFDVREFYVGLVQDLKKRGF